MSSKFLTDSKNNIKDIFHGDLYSIKDMEAAKLSAAVVALGEIFDSDVSNLEKSLAAALVVFEAINYLADNTTIELNGVKVKLSTLAGLSEIATHLTNFVVMYDNVIAEVNDPKGNGKPSEQTIAGILLGVSSVVDTALDLIMSRVPNMGTAALKLFSKAINIGLAYWYVNSESLNEAIEANFVNIQAEHDRLVNELSARTDQYVGYFDTALKKTAQISGLSVEELSSSDDGLLSPAELLKYLNDGAVHDLKNRLSLADQFGLKSSYVEAKAQVDVWLNVEGANGKGLFDFIAEKQIAAWLNTIYTTALDKIQSDILSDTHSDTLNTINAQLAGIINGYSHIDEADKAAILAGWQQKFAGELALERTGTDALLLDEIARLKAEMARLGAGEGTSILDMPNPNNGIKAKLNSNSAFI